MITKEILCGEFINLRQIEMEDCTTTYVDWLNDPDVNQYLETRWSDQTMESIKEFVKSQRENNHSVLFAIILKKGNRHIGNIKIGPVNIHHKHADISYFIGEKDLWNKGITTEAIHLVTAYGFEMLKLHRVEAGAYAGAIGSWKSLEKNGFKREAVFRQQALFGDKYMDIYRYGILETDFSKTKHVEK